VGERMRIKLTGAFEKASLVAMRNYMPSVAKTYLFGKNPLVSRTRYSGKIWDKVCRLADDIGDTLACSEADFESRKFSTGDEGLDLVGWVPMGPRDRARGSWIAFAQCACTLEWVEKQHSSSAQSWRSFITFTIDPTNFVFIPFCYRDAHGNWHDWLDIKQSLVVDRVRLVHLLTESIQSVSRFICPIVDTAL
jgi:hypothetical protein